MKLSLWKRKLKRTSFAISLEETGRKVAVDGVEYSLNRGVDFEESTKVDTLIDNGKYEAYKIVIGQYRNMDLEVSYNFFTNEHNFNLKGATNHSGELGTSADGNITRLDNAIDKMPEKLNYLEENLLAQRNNWKMQKKN